MKTFCQVTSLIFSSIFVINSYAAQPPADPKLHSPQGLYVTASEAYEMISKDPNIVLIDVRTPEEWQFVGYPQLAKMFIPTFTFDYNKVDAKSGRYQPVKNNHYMDQFEDQAANLDVDEDNIYILMCRSGLQGNSRSLPAAKLMNQYGYENVYIMTDGFEGKQAQQGDKKGFRIVNGWKNSGLPWTYKINENNVYSN